MRPSFDEEQILWDSGFDFVIGIDEVGRGAFAGPIVAAGVVFSPKTMSSNGATSICILFFYISKEI